MVLTSRGIVDYFTLLSAESAYSKNYAIGLALLLM